MYKKISVAASRPESYDIRGSAFQSLHIPPVLRLPPELLLEIFFILSNEQVSIPPVLTQIPWVLGRVCSLWRSISRNDARLWGCPQVEWGSELPFCKIERAFSILPPAVRLSVKVMERGASNSHTDFKLLIPYLHRCRILDFFAGINSFRDFWSASIPQNSFTDLYELSLRIYDVTREQRIASATKWESMAGLLHTANQLRSVSLSSELSWSPILFWMGIRWNQLTHLYVQGMSDIPALYNVLCQCDSLVLLSLGTISFYDLAFPGTLSPYKSVPESIEDLHLDHLRNLHVSGQRGRSWIPPLHNWGCLTHLSLPHSYPADYLQDLLQKCVNLTRLSFHSPSDFPLEPFSLLSVRTLEIMNSSYGRLPFSRLVLPSLEELSISDHARLDLSGVSEMLEHSRCPLSYFLLESLSCSVIPRDFLLSMSSVNSKSIAVLFPVGIFSAHILDEIGLGTLLPKFSELVCIPESVDAMLDMLEARIDWQVQQCSSSPERMCMRISTGYKNLSGDQSSRLENLHLRVPSHMDMRILINIHCSFAYKWSITFSE